MENKPALRADLIDWITAYKDAAERNALAETPDESADYILNLIRKEYPIIYREEADEVGYFIRLGWIPPYHLKTVLDGLTVIEDEKVEILFGKKIWGKTLETAADWITEAQLSHTIKEIKCKCGMD